MIKNVENFKIKKFLERKDEVKMELSHVLFVECNFFATTDSNN